MRVGDVIVVEGDIDETRTETCAMSNYRAEETGLATTIWIIAKTNKEKHDPRIKVQKTYGNNITPNDWFSITIEDSPKIIGNTGEIRAKDIKTIIKFVKINQKSLFEHWNNLMSSGELLAIFKKNKKLLK